MNVISLNRAVSRFYPTLFRLECKDDQESYIVQDNIQLLEVRSVYDYPGKDQDQWRAKAESVFLSS